MQSGCIATVYCGCWHMPGGARHRFGGTACRQPRQFGWLILLLLLVLPHGTATVWKRSFLLPCVAGVAGDMGRKLLKLQLLRS